MLKVVTIVGARPQFIKAAVVSRAFNQSGAPVDETIIHTGQHFDQNMSNIFFKELDIPEPDHNLSIGGGTHGQNTGRMIEAIEKKLLESKPDWVLVYGDTDSTLAGAIAASKLHYPVAHVEAGLRSFNRKMPEEINRVLTDHVSNVLFTPTNTATENLKKEAIMGESVKQVGDVMYDAALFYSSKTEDSSQILQTLGLESKSYILATLHRQENVDDKKRLTSILNGFRDSGKRILLPLHPRTKKSLQKFGLVLPENVKVTEPVGYLDMVMLEKHASLVATDSGGVQKEAYFHKVPCITLRDETEWVELVEEKYNMLVGTNAKKISELLSQQANEVTEVKKLYGDGNSGSLIVRELLAN